MAAMVMIGLRLWLGLGDRLRSDAVLLLCRCAGTIVLDRTAQEAIDQRGTLLSAARKNTADAARSSVSTLWLLAFALSLFTFGFAGVAIASILLAGAIMPVLMTGAALSMTIEFQPIERFK